MWRLIIAVVLLLLSLLTVFKAPTNFFWRVAVAVTEFPYIPVLVSLVFFVIFINAKSYKFPALIITGVAFVFYTLPIIQAYVRGNNLPQELSNIFPSKEKTNELDQPFSFFKLGINRIHVLRIKRSSRKSATSRIPAGINMPAYLATQAKPDIAPTGTASRLRCRAGSRW